MGDGDVAVALLPSSPMPGHRGCFYERGIRFRCLRTGGCCRSVEPYGYVYVTLDDRRRLARHLGLTTAAFTRRYCARTDGELHLKHPERDCCFLEGTRCRVHAARPLQCRAWPFWPENMTSARVWRREVLARCPGVGRGRLHSAEEIAGILELQRPSG
jgi:hypothetical protein